MLMSAGLVLLSIICMILLAMQLRQQRKLLLLQRACDEQGKAMANFETTAQGLCAGARHMGDGISGLQQKLRRINERQDTLDMREPDVATYQQAIALVQQGADVAKLMKSCGLARNEAELIHLMHQQQESMHPGYRRLSA